MKVAITGHRPVRIQGREKEIEYWIEEQLINLKACYKEVELIDGMAMGVDQIAAKVAIKLGIPFKCYFAYCRNLSNEEEAIVEESDGIDWGEPSYTGKDVYIDRDRRMVDNCDVLLVVWDGRETGGTYYTYLYAQQQGKNIIKYPWRIR